MKKLLKEPLLHFLLIGVSFFLLYGIVNKKIDSKNTIIINDFDLNNIVASWEMQWKRPPTEKELQNLVNQNIKQEVFYQEALKMNLDHNDEIIKRRLSQKMQFLSNDIASMNAPTDEELQQYYKNHEDKYLTPYSYSLYQVTFSPDNRLDHKKDATETLNQFQKASFDDMKTKGDPLPFPFYYEKTLATDFALQLGSKFPNALKGQKLNTWIGPIPSGFGYHLVYITEMIEPHIRAFDDIKKQLTVDYEYDHQKEVNEAMYKLLKKKYNIKLEIESEDFDPDFIEELQKEMNS